MGAVRPLRPPAASLARFPFSLGHNTLTFVTTVGPALSWGLVITLAQVLLACLLASGRTSADSYRRLMQWDGGWYWSIVDRGYFSPEPVTPQSYGNVAFFPGYPLFARCVKNALGLSTQVALLVAAQVSAWAFWTYLLLFFCRWQAPLRLCVLGVLLVATHPGAFFLVAAYSESLFLTGVLGFLYWSTSERRRSGLLAAGHGFVMTATRLVGLPLVIYPLCHALFCGERTGSERDWMLGRGLLRPLLLGLTASIGALLYFAYCQWQFGAWDIYMTTGHAGWNITPNYLGFFTVKTFRVRHPHWREELIDPEFLSRLAVPVALLLLVGFAYVERRLTRTRTDTGWRYRVGFYVSSFFLLYVPVSAQFSRGMTSMTRYVLCVQVMFALILVHMLTRLQPVEGNWRRRLMWLSVAWCELGSVLQAMLIIRFTHGKWVA
jgi:hypothetical protein